MIPDAPWIREAESIGTDYIDDWLGYGPEDEDEDVEST